MGCTNGIVYFWHFEFYLTVLVTLQSRAMYHISKAFTMACSKLEKIANGMILESCLFSHYFLLLPVSHIGDGKSILSPWYYIIPG